MSEVLGLLASIYGSQGATTTLMLVCLALVAEIRFNLSRLDQHQKLDEWTYTPYATRAIRTLTGRKAAA